MTTKTIILHHSATLGGGFLDHAKSCPTFLPSLLFPTPRRRFRQGTVAERSIKSPDTTRAPPCMALASSGTPVTGVCHCRGSDTGDRRWCCSQLNCLSLELFGGMGWGEWWRRFTDLSRRCINMQPEFERIVLGWLDLEANGKMTRKEPRKGNTTLGCVSKYSP